MNSLSMVELLSRLEQELPVEIFEHALRTAELARSLAEAHGVDTQRAELAALLHDIADRYSDTELLIVAERYGIPVGLTEARVPKLLHGKVGAEILRREWEVADEELLDAVRSHITGSVRMSPLVKVVFVADKLEPGRDRHYGGLDQVRETAMADLNQALLQLYGWRMDELVRAGRPIAGELVDARNRLIDRLLASGR